MYKIKNLTIEDTTFYKGIAIIMIVFHNFFHWVKPSPGENEIIFNKDFIWNYFEIIQSNYFEFIQATFSYFGHYGVQIFIFLSAYGLTKRYKNESIKYLSFIWVRSKKIYIPFVVSIILWFLYVLIAGFTWGNELTALQIITENSQSLIYKVTLVSNFVSNEIYSINGPWWFVSLIIQFYIVYPLLLSISNHEKGNQFLLMIAGFSILISMILNGKLPFFIYGTFIGHLPEFILGIYIAKKEDFKLSYPIIIGSLILFILGNFYSVLWYFSDITVTILLLIILQSIRKRTKGFMEKSILYVGSISMFIFLLNGFLRKPIYLVAGEIQTWYITILLSILFFIFVIAVSSVVDKYYSKISHKI